MIVLAGWSIETTWIRPSMEAPVEGAAGRTQWGGMIPEFRNPPRITLDNDPYYWVSYAREMAATGQFRIRHTDLDNVPFGREVHWNAGFMAWLVACGHVTSWFTGESLYDAIYTGSLYANPVLFILVLAGFGWCVYRRFGIGIAAGFIVLLPALPAVMWDFGYARADHHGMHNTAALGLLLFLLMGGMGWVRSAAASGEALDHAENWMPIPDERTARQCFVVSGLCGAIGLWVGATMQVFILTACGLGILVAIGLTGKAKPSDKFQFQPELLRWWGLAGFCGSILLYGLEYFPSHLGMRLEVNHPVYAFAWLGAAEVLTQLARWRLTGKFPRGKQGGLLLLALVVAILPGIALLFGPSEWHAWRNEFMRRQHDFINEFEPFSRSLQNLPFTNILARFGLLPLVVPCAVVMVCLPKIPVWIRALVLPGLFASILTGAMMAVQVRWSGLLSISLGVLALGVAVLVWHLALGWRWPIRATVAAGLVGVLLLPNFGAFGVGFVENLQRARSHQLDPYLAWMIASRDVAFNLKRIAAREDVRVMSGPGQTPALHFFGAIHGTGALYWENIDGVRDAAAFFSDPGDERALRIVRERGITHVVIEQSPSMAEQSCAIFYGDPSREQIEQSLAWRLANPLGTVPEWLEPIPYYGSPMAANFLMRIYKVRPSGFQ